MVLEPDRALTEVTAAGAPKLLGRPAEAPLPLPHFGGSEPIRTLHEQWAGRAPGPRPASVRQAARAWVSGSPILGRGRANRRLLGSLIRTTDALAAHCDQIADRLAAQEALVQEVTEAFGEDVTRLRAEVLRLQRLIPSENAKPGE